MANKSLFSESTENIVSVPDPTEMECRFILKLSRLGLWDRQCRRAATVIRFCSPDSAADPFWRSGNADRVLCDDIASFIISTSLITKLILEHILHCLSQVPKVLLQHWLLLILSGVKASEKEGKEGETKKEYKKA